MEIKDITFSYQDKVRRLHQVTVEIKKGAITTIIGPNGSGKSTLMGVLTNMLTPEQGQIILDGKELNRYRPKELAKILGVVHQQNIAPADMTVEKLIYYGRLPYKKTFSPSSIKDAEMVDWALACTGLADKRHMTLDQLSGGQQQRAWIAMALAQDTKYLFLDEPTSNLDLYYQYEILQLVQQLRNEQGLTIVMVLHDINQALQYSDRIIAMKDGRLIASGSPADTITEGLIHELYGIDVVVREDKTLGKYIVPLGI